MILKDKVFIVTGASSGIGEEICKQLSASGSNVVCASRRLEELQRVSNAINAFKIWLVINLNNGCDSCNGPPIASNSAAVIPPGANE